MGRQNTIRIGYDGLANKPGLGMLQEFCAKKLGLKRGEVIRLQNSRALGVTFLTVRDEAHARKLCDEHDKRHVFTANDKKQYRITLAMEDGTVEVKLYDLSDDVSDDAVKEFLGKYGEVKSIYEEQLGDDQEFAGAYTGVRVIKMVVKQNIESWVTINGEMTQCTYYGQRQTCKHCRDFAHVGVGCVQNKKLLVQKTFADAVKQPAKPQNPKGKLPTKPTGEKKQPSPVVDPVLPKTSPEMPKASPDQPKTFSVVLTDIQAPSSSGVSPFLEPRAPAGKMPSDSGLLDKFLNQLPHGGGGAASKTNTGKSDGNETDTSLASSSSRRSNRSRPSKKLKGDNERGEEDEEL